jgi:AbrB family looped-hinge helix DNA binding protein
MDIAITKISSKGQIVIPTELREDMKEGDKIMIIKQDKQIIMKKVSDLDRKLADDLVGQFAKSLEDLKNGRIRRVA